MAPEAELVVLKVMLVLMKYLRPEESIRAIEPVALGLMPLLFGRPAATFAACLRSLPMARRSTSETSAEASWAVNRAVRAQTTSRLTGINLRKISNTIGWQGLGSRNSYHRSRF